MSDNNPDPGKAADTSKRSRESPEPQTGLRGHRVLNPARRSARRQEILLATAIVLAEKGYDATTLDDVAGQMGCSKAVIYYQFRSKAEIYIALTEQVSTNATARLRAIVSDGNPPEVELRKALTDLVTLGWQPPDYATIRIRRPNSLPIETLRRLRRLDREYESLFTGVVARGMEAGILVRRDPRLVAFTLINAVHSVFRWARPGGALTPETFAKEVPAMLLEGVLRRDADAEDAARG